jgi:hypothetical protein
VQYYPKAQEALFEAPHGLLQVKPEEAARVVGEFVRGVGSHGMSNKY